MYTYVGFLNLLIWLKRNREILTRTEFDDVKKQNSALDFSLLLITLINFYLYLLLTLLLPEYKKRRVLKNQ